MKNRNLSATQMVLALVAAGVVGGAGTGLLYGSRARASNPPAVVAAAVPNALGTVTAPDFSQVVERYGPAVVNVSVSGIHHVANDEGNGPGMSGRGLPGLDPNDPLFEFFRRFQPPNGGNPGPQDTPTRAQGSGFIISSDGLILTNAHVVRDAKVVTVKLTDRREFQAKVLGADPKTDVAVLKIEAANLPVVTMGSARDLKVGEWVLAIGSPFGFDNSVTAGVVSAKHRSLPDDSFVPFIQTDVAVNPGNSGGPLLNARGEVIGINSQIYSGTGGYQGVSFAIPIDLVTQVKDQIVATGQARHARLGVAIQEVNQVFADSFKLDKPEGALVSSIDKGGPADQAGLKAGDVILKVDGQPIVTSGDLPALIGQSAPGQKIVLEIWRQGKRQELNAQLGDASAKAGKSATADDAAAKDKLGLALRPLQQQEKREAGVDGGLVVAGASGPAAMAGVQAGDVLLAINGKPVTSIDQVRELVAKSNKSVALLIQRDGNKIFVPVRIG